MALKANWLELLLGGVKALLLNGVELPPRSIVNIIAEGATSEDQGETEDRVDITIPAGEGGTGTPYDDDPEPVATSEGGAGSSDSFARGDHVHSHGTHSNGSLHAAVVAAGASGFMTGGDKTKLDGIAASAAALSSGVAGDASADVGATALGTGTRAARWDHVHAHGNQAGDALHAAANGSTAGFMSAAHYTAVQGRTAAATASTMVERGSSGEAAFGYVTTPSIRSSGAIGIRPDGASVDLTLTEVGGTLYWDAGARPADLRASFGMTVGSAAGNVAISAANQASVSGTNSVVLASGAGGVIANCDGSVGVGFDAYGTGTGNRIKFRWLRQPRTTTTAGVPTGFSFAPDTDGGDYEVTVRAKIGTDFAVWVFRCGAHSDGSAAWFTAGYAPTAGFASSPALAGLQAQLQENGSTIECMVQQDTTSSVTWSMSIRRVS